MERNNLVSWTSIISGFATRRTPKELSFSLINDNVHVEEQKLKELRNNSFAS